MTISDDDGGGRARRGAWNPRRESETAMGVPASDTNAVQVLRNGDEIFPALVHSIRSSTRGVDLSTFVLTSLPQERAGDAQTPEDPPKPARSAAHRSSSKELMTASTWAVSALWGPQVVGPSSRTTPMTRP